MRTLRRYDIRNAYYFITIVTFNREKILIQDINLFWLSWNFIGLEAWVILPDRCHFIVKVDDSSISQIVHKFKITYSRRFRDKYRPGKVWQNRFWDHIIRNEQDMNKHIDYIHYNPVKHGYVNDPFEYEHSSLIDYLKNGYYERNWGIIEKLNFEGDFGEYI